MPRPPRFNISALRELLIQLRYAPTETKKREMEAAESLLAEINPSQTYPEDYIIFRITAYRPNIESPAMMLGKPLMRDLAVFIERLSDALALPASRYAPRQPLTIEQVSDRLNVSLTTLHRYRRIGLVAHQIVDESGRKSLCIFEDALERFTQRNTNRVARAGEFSHVSQAQKFKLFRRAKRYRDSLGWSISQVADRLGPQVHRTSEAVRQLLRRHDADVSPGERIFAAEKRFRRRELRFIERATDRFLPIHRIASRIGCTRPAIYRIVNLNRVQRISAWPMSFHHLPTFEMPDADEILLAIGVVQHDLAPSPPIGGDFVEWIESVRTSSSALDREAEVAWFGAMNYLLYLADKERTCLDLHHPSGSLLDRIETRLRWASALKRRIISAHLADALKTLEIHLEQSLNACTASMIRALHQLAISIAIRSVDEFDPTQRQRFKTAFLYSLRRTLAAGPNIGGDRSISARSSASSAVSARPKWTRGSMTLDDFAHRMFEWDRRLQLTPAELERSQSDTLDPQARQILAMRFGLDGCVPQTCDAIGSSLGIGPEHVAAAEYRNRRLLREDRLADRDGF